MLLYSQLLILIVLVVLNVTYGIGKGLYDLVWWWDIPAHFLGGAWVGLFTAWFLQLRDRRFSVVRCAAGALSVGIGWEIFEYYFQLGHNPHFSYWADTIKDVAIDTLGGSLAGAAALLQKSLWQK